MPLHPSRTAPRSVLPRVIRTAGFTLVELMVTVAIVAVLLRLAVPALSSAILSNKLSSYANAWVASAQLARGEAVKRNAAVTLCRSSDGSTCATSGSWQQGWVVRAADGTVIHAEQALSSDYHFTSSSYSIAFQPSGLSSGSTTLTLCRALPSVGDQERQITLSATGKAAVAKTTLRTCT